MNFFKLALILLLFPVLAHSQDLPTPSLNIGDPAPPLSVREWLKGTPIERFRKGRVYVVEFWATWCAPCRAAMPHLTNLAREYKDKITFIGVDVMETEKTSMEHIRRFVDSMGHKMDYNVAAEDSNFMETGWLQASGVQGIPTSYVVDAESRLAWIGHPSKLDQVLPEILNNNWNYKKALGKRSSDKYLRELDVEMNFNLMDHFGKPDSILLAIDKIVQKEPRLKYAPFIAYNTFSSLLKTNLQKAYEYGKTVLVTPSYEDPAYDIIIGAIQWRSVTLDLPPEIYRLGTEAQQAVLDHFPYPELLNMPKRYNQMAEWYWRANDTLSAIDAQQKAIDALKSKANSLPTELALFGFKLRQYRSVYK